MEVPDRPHRWTVAGAAAEAQAKALREKPAQSDKEKSSGWHWGWKAFFAGVGGIGVPYFYLYMMGYEPRLRRALERMGLGFHVDWLRRWFPRRFDDENVVEEMARRLDAAVQKQPVDVVFLLRDGSERRVANAPPDISEAALMSQQNLSPEDVLDVVYLDSKLSDEAERISKALEALQRSVEDARPLRSRAVAGRTFREPETRPEDAHHFYDHPQFAEQRKYCSIGGNMIPFHNAPSLWLPPVGLPGLQEMRQQRKADLRYPSGDRAVEMARQIRAMISKAEAELRYGTDRDIDTVQEELQLLRSELWVLKKQNWSNLRAWLQ